MRLSCIFVVAAGCALSVAAFATDVVEKQLPLPQGGKVEVHNIAGLVRVETWDQPDLWVNAALGADCEGVDFNDSGNGIEVVVKVKDGKSGKNSRTDVRVKIPAQSDTVIETISADVEVQREGGTLEISTASGGIRAALNGLRATLHSISGALSLSGKVDQVEMKSASGEVNAEVEAKSLRAETVSGDVYLKGSQERLNVSTTSGDIVHAGSAGHVEASTVSGEIELAHVTQGADAFTSGGDILVGGEDLGELHAESVSGDIEFKGSLSPSATVEVSSKSGDITLQLPEDTPARFVLRTFSGDLTAPGQASDDVKELNFDRAPATARVNAQTFSGDVTISGQSPAE